MKINDFTKALESKYGISMEDTSNRRLTESVDCSILEESCKKSLSESADARPNHMKIIDLIEDGLIDYKFIAEELLRWMPDDKLGELIDMYDLDYESDDLEESKGNPVEEALTEESRGTVNLGQYAQWYNLATPNQMMQLTGMDPYDEDVQSVLDSYGLKYVGWAVAKDEYFHILGDYGLEYCLVAQHPETQEIDLYEWVGERLYPAIHDIMLIDFDNYKEDDDLYELEESKGNPVDKRAEYRDYLTKGAANSNIYDDMAKHPRKGFKQGRGVVPDVVMKSVADAGYARQKLKKDFDDYKEFKNRNQVKEFAKYRKG